MYGWEKSFDSVALMRAKAIDGSRVTITKRMRHILMRR